jgi:hypothetical protein
METHLVELEDEDELAAREEDHDARHHHVHLPAQIFGDNPTRIGKTKGQSYSNVHLPAQIQSDHPTRKGKEKSSGLSESGLCGSAKKPLHGVKKGKYRTGAVMRTEPDTGD